MNRARATTEARKTLVASGSMSGDGWGYGSESANTVSRIEKVRSTLAKVLPSIGRLRRLGLITFGPGPYNQCTNITLQLKPTPNAADRILSIVSDLVPAGRTPLTSAVEQAASVLDFRKKPGIIVLLTALQIPLRFRWCEMNYALGVPLWAAL